MNVRRLGVYGENLPPKRAQGVQAADFAISGIVAQFPRQFDRSFAVTSPEELARIVGDQEISSYYGWDAVSGFFSNTEGVNATLYVAPYVGYDGSAIDAEAATATVEDTQSTAEDVLELTSAYEGETAYGAFGNRTGFRIERGARFETEAAASAASSDTEVELDSVADIMVGDLILFKLDDGNTEVWHKVEDVSEVARKVTIDSSLHDTESLAEGDVVEIPGFRVKVYQRTLNGREEEVEQGLGSQWLTTEEEVADYYAGNVFEDSARIKIDVLSTSADYEDRFPKEITETTMLSGGTDGTSPSGASNWDKALRNLDDDPVRVIFNPETTDEAVQNAMAEYASNRDDSPKVLVNISEDRTKAQLRQIGSKNQTSGKTVKVIVANWLKVEDPFNSATVAPPRHVPNVGHVSGVWMRSITRKGVHYIPATNDMPIRGIVGVVGKQFLDDQDRTELAESSINVIQERNGVTTVRNFFTASTDKAYRFANGILMRDFIKVSAVESLQGSENKPNTFERIKADKGAIEQFLFRMWERGSTGRNPRGEFFGQSFRDNGAATQPTDHWQVKADVANNPVTKIEAGERNIDMWFTYPAPAGSIRIGVGILLRG